MLNRSIEPNQPAAATAPLTDSRAQWELRASRRIERAPGSPLDSASMFRRNEFITAAYAEMYLRDPQVYKWAGMAALTSAAVGRGMYMIHCLKQTFVLGTLIGLLYRDVRTVYENLGVGNAAVFNDIYWQHMAYDHGGLDELTRIFEAGRLHPAAYDGWTLIDAGRRAGDQALVWEGNRRLLYFEQKEVLQPAVYDGHAALWREMSGWIASPMPGQHQTIVNYDRRANIGVFADRWAWIERSMLPYWQKLSEAQPRRVEAALHTLITGGAPFSLRGLSAGRLLGQGMYGAWTAA